MLSTKDIYRKLQLGFLQLTGLKIGDKVKIKAKAKSLQFGWTGYWTDEMSAMLGESFKISQIFNKENVIGIQVDGTFHFPFFALELPNLDSKQRQRLYARMEHGWITLNRVSKDDRVEIVAKAAPGQFGWQNSWTGDMDNHVGNTASIRYIGSDVISDTATYSSGIGLKEDGTVGYNYPFFVLKKLWE